MILFFMILIIIGMNIGTYTANNTFVKYAIGNMQRKIIGTRRDRSLANFITIGSMGASISLFFGLEMYLHIK